MKGQGTMTIDPPAPQRPYPSPPLIEWVDASRFVALIEEETNEAGGDREAAYRHLKAQGFAVRPYGPRWDAALIEAGGDRVEAHRRLKATQEAT